MAKTKAHVKNGRLVILTQDAIDPGVTSLALDQAQSGAFEIAAAGDAFKLSFRPSGRKTGDALASYDSRAKAERALQNVYAALSGGSSKFGKVAKTIGWAVLALCVLIVVMSFFTPSETATPSKDMVTVPGLVAPEAAAPLPVGEPFPVDDFVNQTQDGSE